MAYEVAVLQQWLYGTLGSACASINLGGTPVYSPLAPEGCSFPYYRYQVLSAQDDVAIAPRRVHTIYVVRVAAVTGGTANVSLLGGTPSLATMMGTADAYLDNAQTTYGGQRIVVLREEQIGPLSYVEVGETFMELAGRYRCWLSNS